MQNPWWLAALVLACLFDASTSDAADRPNVVVIVADDLGAHDLGCYGSRVYQTPRLDQLASEGIRFTQAYAACPVCSPTRAALLTGRHPARIHLTDFIPGERDLLRHRLIGPEFHQQLPLEEVTLAEQLAQAGYVTAAIGKWHLGGEGFAPQDQGFQIAKGGGPNGSVKSHFAPYVQREGMTLPGLENAPPGEYLADRLTSEADRFIEQNAARPFFLYLPHYAVHTPIMGKPTDVARYQKRLPASELQDNPQYAAMVDNLDQCVGRILDRLAALKLTERTLVIFTSDNGGLATSGGPRTAATNNGPLRDGKGYLYEGGIRVPLIMSWPGTIPPRRIEAVPTSTADLPVTLAEVCGVAMPTAVDGISLCSLWSGGPAPRREALHWHYPHYSPQGGRPGSAIRAGDYKLIEFHEQNRRELFDLAKDPSESTNLAEQQPERAAALAEQLHAWLREVDAQMPRVNDKFVAESQAADGTLTLAAETADVHGVMLRYEPVAHKNTLGFWVRQQDWASWDFSIDRPGAFDVEILQGCGGGSGGSQVDFSIADQTVTTKVVETGGFQNFVPRMIGTVQIARPGRYTLTVKPRSKPGPAVMDLRQVRLIPRSAAAKP